MLAKGSFFFALFSSFNLYCSELGRLSFSRRMSLPKVLPCRSKLSNHSSVSTISWSSTFIPKVTLTRSLFTLDTPESISLNHLCHAIRKPPTPHLVPTQCPVSETTVPPDEVMTWCSANQTDIHPGVFHPTTCLDLLKRRQGHT